MLSPKSGGRLVMTASIPLNRDGDDSLQTPRAKLDKGGFDEAVVGLSHLLPVEVFAPGEFE